MNGVNVDFCMRMEVLMALQQMWGWLISTWMFVFSSCLIYLIAISIKLCIKRQKNERKQVEERRRGVCAEVRFYTLLFVLLFSLSGCSKCEGCLSIDPGEHLSYFPMLLSHMLSCPLASSLHLSISFDIKQLESVLFVKFLFFCWKTFVVKQGSGISVCVWVCVCGVNVFVY